MRHVTTAYPFLRAIVLALLMLPFMTSPVYAATELCPNGVHEVSFGVGDPLEIPCDSAAAFSGWVLTRAIVVATTAAFFLIVVGGYKILASRGDSSRVQSGQETITNAIIGLVFIIMSAFILRFIGIQLIGIPGV